MHKHFSLSLKKERPLLFNILYIVYSFPQYWEWEQKRLFVETGFLWSQIRLSVPTASLDSCKIPWENKYKFPSIYYPRGTGSSLVESEVFLDNVVNPSFSHAFKCLYNRLSFLVEEFRWNVLKGCFNHSLTILCNPNLTFHQPVRQIQGYTMMAMGVQSQLILYRFEKLQLE